MKCFHLSLAVLLGLAAPAAPMFAQGAGRLDPQPPAPATGPVPVSLPPLSPPSGRAALTGVPLPDPPARRGNGQLYRSWAYPASMPFLIYPVDMTHPLWVEQDGMTAHDLHGGIPAPAVEHRVILRDGIVLPARSAPRLAGGTVRFTDPHGVLVSLRASEVDLPATAAANDLDWRGALSKASAAPVASTAAAPPRP
ncbi:MAG TPA: hypothetical protein VMW75_11745 [Thermoanaerobaculia bacterium]|nr:hypothetical protein [Thermoanaerobaculia bacterium]